jgi:hypothetical protein
MFTNEKMDLEQQARLHSGNPNSRASSARRSIGEAPAVKSSNHVLQASKSGNFIAAKLERYGLSEKLGISKKPKRTRVTRSDVDVGPTDTTHRGLKEKYRSETYREQRYHEWKEIQSGKSSYINLETGQEMRVDPHPLLVNTCMIINRENAISKDRSRQRLLNRRFNLDIRDIWLSNLRHIADLKNISNSYTTAQGFVDYDEDDAITENESGTQSNWGTVSLHREEEEREHGLKNRRDVKALSDLKYQIQSVSVARAQHNAYHSTYMSSPKIVLDYKAPPTPLLMPPPPEPPLLDPIVPGVLLQAVNSRLQRTTASDSMHLTAWASKSAATTLSNKLSDPCTKDSDVILYVDRLVPSFSNGVCTEAGKNLTDSSSIFWRLLAIRRGDGKSAFVIGKELEIADFVGSVWLEDTADPTVTVVNETEDDIFEDDFEFLRSAASGKEPLTITVFERHIAVRTVESQHELDVDGSEPGDPSNNLSLRDKSLKATTLVNIISRQGKMVPFCASSAETNDDMYCRLNRSIDVEVHVSITNSEIEKVLGNDYAARRSKDDNHNYEDTDGQYVELILTTSPMELQQLLRIPISPVNNLSWWTDSARSGDVWPGLCSKLRILFISGELSIDFMKCSRFRNGSGLAHRAENSLSTSQAFAIAQELIAQVVVQYESASAVGQNPDTNVDGSNGLAVYIPGAPPGLLTAVSGRRPRSAKSNKSRLSGLFANSPNSKEVRNGNLDVEPTESEGNRPQLSSAKSRKSQKNKGNWESWEDLSGSSHCLSLQLNGGVQRLAYVPGACELGISGIWQRPPKRIQQEFTRVAAVFFRDPLVSSTNTVLVHLCLGIEVPMQFPCMQAWEDGSVCPLKAAFEPVVHVVSGMMHRARKVLHEKLLSPIDRLSDTVMVFVTACSEGYDRIPVCAPSFPATLAKYKYPVGDVGSTEMPTTEGETEVSTTRRGGFRNSVHVTLLNTDPISPTYIFGLTELGATFNGTGINPRNIWKSSLVIREFVNQELLPKDYHYIISCKSTSALNDRFIHTIHLSGDEFNHLQRIPLRNYDDFYREIQERREIFNRQLALSNLIERNTVRKSLYVIYIDNPVAADDGKGKRESQEASVATGRPASI